MRVMISVGKGVRLHSAVCFMSMDVCLRCVWVSIFGLYFVWLYLLWVLLCTSALRFLFDSWTQNSIGCIFFIFFFLYEFKCTKNCVIFLFLRLSFFCKTYCTFRQQCWNKPLFTAGLFCLCVVWLEKKLFPSLHELRMKNAGRKKTSLKG